MISVNAGRAPMGAALKPPLSVFLMKVSGDFPDQTDTLSSPSFSLSFCPDFPRFPQVNRGSTERERGWISPSPLLSGDIFPSRKVNLAYLDLKKVRRRSRSWYGMAHGWGGAAREFETGRAGGRKKTKRKEGTAAEA